MKSLRLAVATSAAVLAITAGCAVSPPDNTYAFTPGNGTIESVREARVAIPGGKAPSTWLKDTTKPRWMQGYQLGLRMDDGTTQMITQDSDAFHPGDRVQITQEGRVLKASPAAPASAAGATVAPIR
jgi:outer membrane lipoprotein SlyB